MTSFIAHVNASRGFRGGERQTELLIEELQKYGYKQALIARKNRALARRAKHKDIDLREVSGNPISVALACRGVDLIHVHEGRSVYGAYLKWFFSKTPYIITRRVDNPIRQHRFARKAYGNASAIAAVAPQVAKIVKQYDTQLNPKVVHSGSSNLPVNEENVQNIRNRYCKNSFLVGHVGALDNNQKGQEFIIAVAHELQDSHPNIHFLLVGGGDDEKILKEQAKNLKNLSFEGFVNNVGDYLAAFDIFILPSLREGIGSILIDAMQKNLPLIASSVGGVPDIVHHNENGILIEPARPDLLKKAILHMQSDPTFRARLGQNGKQLSKSYTANVMCKKYIKIYESILTKID